MANQKEGKKSLREQQLEDRRKKMKELNPPLERVRVTPASDELRKALMHPKGNVKFPEKGSVEWPLDQFTRRRIKEGSVTREERRERHEQAAQPQQQPQSQPQHQSAPTPPPPQKPAA